MSETIRVSRQTKEALLRVAANLQASTGKRVDFDEAIGYLVQQGEKIPDSFTRFVGSLKGVEARQALDDLAEERRRDELRAKRKYDG